MRLGKQQVMEEILPSLLLHINDHKIENLFLESQQGESANLNLEIGFGGGEHLSMQLARGGHENWIGCEPYINGMGDLLKKLSEDMHQYLRLYGGDARDIIENLPLESLNSVYILFPDPWPKLRHHKRRLIQTEFIEYLAARMKKGATLLIATDHEDYLLWILEVMLISPSFYWSANQQADWLNEPTHWVKTKYQSKAIAEGRIPVFLKFHKI